MNKIRFNLSCLFLCLFILMNHPSNAISDVTTGRSLLFFSGSPPDGDPTYSSICSANQEFQATVLAEPANQEANLFYAVTRLPAFAIENNAFQDLLLGFGIMRTVNDLLGEPLYSEPPFNPDGSYNPPDNAKNMKDVQDLLAGSFLAEVEGAIANLNQISPTTSPIVTLTPTETRDTLVEIDYGDVLLFKASLYFLKCNILTISAYNMNLDTNELEWHQSEDLIHNIQDFLEYYPDFLTLYTNNIGAERLANARIALTDAITAYEDAINYIKAESDYQGDDMFYFDSPEDEEESAIHITYLTEVRASINEKRPAEYTQIKSFYTLTFDDDPARTLCLGLQEDPDGHVLDVGVELPGSYCSSNYPFEYLYSTDGGSVLDDYLTLPLMGRSAEGYWGNALLEGTFTGDEISGSYDLHFWWQGTDTSGTFIGDFQGDEIETFRFDLNRLYGNGEKSPLDLRLILPGFDENDEIICGSFPGNPILNGVLPDYQTNGSLNTLLEWDCEIFEDPVIHDISFNQCISELDTTTITLSASDPAGGDLSYTWTATNGGTITGDGANVVFEPPESDFHPCPYQIELTVESNNSFLSTTRFIDTAVTLAGDINQDGDVDGLDLAICAGFYSGQDLTPYAYRFGRNDGCLCTTD